MGLQWLQVHYWSFILMITWIRCQISEWQLISGTDNRDLGYRDKPVMSEMKGLSFSGLTVVDCRRIFAVTYLISRLIYSHFLYTLCLKSATLFTFNSNLNIKPREMDLDHRKFKIITTEVERNGHGKMAMGMGKPCLGQAGISPPFLPYLNIILHLQLLPGVR